MKTYKWHKIADSLEELHFAENGTTEIDVAGKKICLVYNNENIFACTAKCPHAGGTMANGYIDALQNIVCPLHRYKFSLHNGHNTSGEGYYLKTYPVELRENGIFIGIEAAGVFNWLK